MKRDALHQKEIELCAILEKHIPYLSLARTVPKKRGTNGTRNNRGYFSTHFIFKSAENMISKNKKESLFE
jgi:hypothetical protein